MPDYTLHLISGPLRFGASEDDAKRLATELQTHNDEVVRLRAEVEALKAEDVRLRNACSKENDDICQTLGSALGYPKFVDDPAIFPGATEADGVCIGDHVAASLACEAADMIAKLQGEVEALRVDAERYRFVRIADGIRISLKAARDPVVYDAAIDAARAAQGDKT